MKNKTAPRFFIFAGELSADLHGGNLVRALKNQFGSIEFTGVSGPSLRAQEVEGPLEMEDFCVMGFSDVLRSLPRLLLQFRTIRNYLLKTQPDVAIFIDSPSFSLPMAKSLRKAGFKGKIVQYICPTVWAWNKGRIKKMADSFDLLLTIYPFEPQYFMHTRLPAVYVGNPLQESIQNHCYDSQWKKHFGIKPSSEIIALFPGSRTSEIVRNLPPQLEAALLLRKEHPKTTIAISCAHDHNQDLVQKILLQSKVNSKDIYLIPKAYSYDLMRSCKSAIAKSGTVTLELALHQRPTVVTFKMSWLNMMIAKYALRINLPHYCIVNILSAKTVFPELITEGFTPENICSQLQLLHNESARRSDCIAGCLEVKRILQENDASSRAAKAIEEILTC